MFLNAWVGDIAKITHKCVFVCVQDVFTLYSWCFGLTPDLLRPWSGCCMCWNGASEPRHRTCRCVSVSKVKWNGRTRPFLFKAPTLHSAGCAQCGGGQRGSEMPRRRWYRAVVVKPDNVRVRSSPSSFSGSSILTWLWCQMSALFLPIPAPRV